VFGRPEAAEAKKLWIVAAGSVLGRFGAVDILVNNAGIQHVAPVEEFPVDKWNAIIAINLSAAFHTTRLALPAMKKKRWGRIVNIASAHALVASPFKRPTSPPSTASPGSPRRWRSRRPSTGSR